MGKIVAILIILSLVLLSPLIFIGAAIGVLAIFRWIVLAITAVCEAVDRMIYGDEDEH